MGQKYLEFPFDIHSGGVDHIPVHHENEIAQNEALTGKKTVNYWVHSEFMLVNNGKMSKSLGNTYTIDQLIDKGYSPIEFRYFCLNAMYRKKLNFTFEGMDSAKVSYTRLLQSLAKHREGSAEVDTSKYLNDFREAINDDLNIPLALGVLWSMLKEKPSRQVYETALEMDKVFALDLHLAKVEEEVVDEIPSEVMALVLERTQAKKDKNYARADEIRGIVDTMGYLITDTKDGAKVTKK